MRPKRIGFYLASLALSLVALWAALYLDGFFVDTGPVDSPLAASGRPGGESQAEQGSNRSGSQPLFSQAEPDEPSPPLNVQVVHRAPGLVRLAWDGAALPQSHEVAYWHVGDSNSEWIVLPKAGIQVEMDVEDRYGAWISELPEHPDKVHYFAVRTVTNGNPSAWTETISTAGHFSPSPEPEREMQASVLSVVNQESVFEPNIVERVTTRLALPQKLTGRYHTRESIVLDWEDVPGAHAYRVRIWDEARVGWSVLPTERFPISWDGSRAVVRFALDSFDAVMKSQLMFSVQAVGEGGRSSWTKPVGVPLVLDTPTGLFGQSHEGNRIGLDWQDVPLADFYEIRYRSSASPDSQWIMLSGATGIRVTMDGSSAYIDSLPGGDSFVFQVRAITGNYEVCSDWSEDVGITQSGEPGTEPGTPPGTEPAPETSLGNTPERTSKPTPQPTPTPRPTDERTTEPDPHPTPHTTPDADTPTGGANGPGTGTDAQDGPSILYSPERIKLQQLHLDPETVDPETDLKIILKPDNSGTGKFTIDVGKLPPDASPRVHLGFKSLPEEGKVEICIPNNDPNNDPCEKYQDVTKKFKDIKPPETGESMFQFQRSKESKESFTLKVTGVKPGDEIEILVGATFAGQSIVIYCGIEELESKACNAPDFPKSTPITIQY